MTWLRRFEELPSGPDKVRPLRDAIAEAVRPSMSLHFAFTHNRPAAALAEVLRQFRGTEAHVLDLAARVGFAFEVAADLPVEAPPTTEELQRLRLLDPDRSFLGSLEA